jgi:hypothetical protein
VRQSLLFLFPRRRAPPGERREDVACAPGRPNDSLEMIAPIVHPDVAAWQATEPEVPQPTVPKVLESHLDHRPVVDPHSGETEVEERFPQVYRGQTGRTHGFGHRAVINAGQNPVAVPGFQPVRRRITQALGLEGEKPRVSMLPQVAGDAPEQATSVSP